MTGLTVPSGASCLRVFLTPASVSLWTPGSQINHFVKMLMRKKSRTVAASGRGREWRGGVQRGPSFSVGS